MIAACRRHVIAPLVGLIAALTAAGPAAAADWRTYAGGPRRLFFNPDETAITPANAGRLQVKWTFRTGGIVTASPSVVRLDVPGEGVVPIVFIQSWDANLYALRLYDGSELWRFQAEEHPGGSYPNAGSVEVARVDGRELVYFGAGEIFYCVDALTGDEIWRFVVGTDCKLSGLCAFTGERNEIEASPIVADGKVFIAMDVNDVATGKGGFYALAALDGRLVWYFDVTTGATCRPLPGDDIRRFDGYHTETELGLPPGFLATRPGCDFDRTANGCGNIWSSPAWDEERGLLFFTTSNCDTDDDPATGEPPPPMPPYEEAVVAIGLDGTPAWRWRPREIDNNDLAWGAVPNLFTIDVDGTPRDVVGAGNKDGTYYVLDRDGVNARNGARWDDPDAATHLPYWATNVVAGGPLGGIIATAAVDEAAGRVYFTTAPGFDPLQPQLPTVHALDAATGAVIWGNTTDPADPDADASFAPTSAVPGVVFAGSVLGGFVRVYDAATGRKLGSVQVGTAVASAGVVTDGIFVVGSGVGERRANREAPSDIASRVPENVTALCVPGTPHCPVLLAGKRLLVKDDPRRTAKRRIVVLSKDKGALVVPEPGSAAAPTGGGGRLEITNPATRASQVIPLPAANWKGIGRPAGSKGYSYKDGKGAAGPCRKVLVRKDKVLKAVCKGDAVAFGLGDAPQGSLRVTLTTGTESHAWCMLFGGTVTRDTAPAGRRAGVFRAKNALRPGGCP